MSTISASTTTTTAYKVTADTTGTLVLQTGSSPTTAMTIDGSQNVGIGTASPAGRLDSYGDSTNPAGIFRRGGAYGNIESSDAGRSNRWTLGRDNASTGNFVVAYNDSTKATLDTSGNLGLGVTPSTRLDVGFASGSGNFRLGVIASNNIKAYNTAGDLFLLTSDASSDVGLDSQRNVIFKTANTERARIDSSGNVGVGTSSPNAKLDVSSGDIIVANGGNVGDAGGGLYFKTATNSSYSAMAEIKGLLENAPGTEQQGGIGFFTRTLGSSGQSLLERARFNANGSFIVGATSLVSSGKIEVAATAASNQGLNIKDTGANNLTYIGFFNSSGTVAGTITHTGSTTVAYNTSSDYRLKENVTPMVDALATVAALKPCNYTWKEDGTAGQGFIAHELQAVVPDCVTGEKDAVDEEGKPVYQGIDTSFLVATLTAAIQEQQAIINTLTERITALENK